MKHRIQYSENERLYRIESKRIFGKWETLSSYTYTDLKGNIVRTKGFFTYQLAEEWVNDRFPKTNNLNEIEKNKNMGFEF
jgi:hypothetical protein